MLKIKQRKHNEFLKPTIALSIPIMLQALLVNGVTFADTLMIGQLGEISIAAVGVASQLFFLVTMFLYGISSAGGIFISQFWGAQDKRGIQKVLGLSFIFTLITCGLIAILSTLFPSIIMKIFTQDQNVINGGNTYLKIVGFSYILTGFSFMYAVGLRSTGDAKTPLIISIVSLSVDVIGNYLLIFGIGIFPELGIAGGAISTSLSRIVELILYIIITNKKKDCPVKFSFKYSLDFDKSFVKRFFNTAIPVVINDIMWSLGMVCYKVAYSKIGTEALAAVQIIESINNLFFVTIQGFSGAVAIILGNMIGAKRENKAKDYANFSLVFSLITGVLIGLLIAISSSSFVSLFHINKEVSNIAEKSLFMIALLMPIKFLTMDQVLGLLRGGGDTKYSLYLEMCSIWLVGVPMAFLGVLVFHLPLPYIYLLVGTEEITKMIFGFQRIHSGKFIHKLI
ncbi:MAG: MATE family efflux transporter [Spirochaetaceae bacterium]|nr:MATE family efflux transporter [Spirochaetaceae bacterium]